DQARAVRDSLARLQVEVKGRVPAEVEERVVSIARSVTDILERENGLRVGSRQLFTLLRTATDYLPTALDAYLRLPAAYATTRRLQGGQTAAEILVAQLDLLAAEMVAVAD